MKTLSDLLGKSGILGAALAMAGGFLGGEIRSRADAQTAIATLQTRVAALEQARTDTGDGGYVTRGEFQQFEQAVLRSLADMRDELHRR